MKHYSTYQSQFIEMFGNVKDSRSLCEICRPKQWPTIPTKDFTEDGYLVYGANGVIGHYSEFNHEFPTILMACRGASCGAINISQPNSYITGNAMCMDEIIPEVSFEYLAYFLSNYDYKTIITGGAQPQITYTNLKKVMVPIPPYSEQLNFTLIYQQADKSKFSNLKSQFIEMFEGDKYPRISLDAIADEWLKGQAFKKDEICENGDKHCIHYGELFTKYGPVIKEVVSKTSVELKKPSKNGDILFPASDVTPNGLARCSMLPYDNVVLGGDIIVLRPKEGYSPAYLSYAINQQTTQLLARVNGGLVKHLSAKGLKTVEIPIPSKEKQEEYIRIAEQADKSKLIQNTLLNNKPKFCYCYTPRHISS